MLNSQSILQRLRILLDDPSTFYPLHEPRFDEHVANEVRDCVSSGWVSSAGNNIIALEQKCSEILNRKYCVAISSGTSALHLAYLAVKIQPGTEVFCPGISFVATVNALKYVGAEPYFVDIDRCSLCLDADKLLQEIHNNCDLINGRLINKSNRRTISAIITVNAFGNSSDLTKLSEIANMYNLRLIEDAAGAFGSRYMDQSPGKFSDVAAYSFNGNKIVTGGTGGLIATDNVEIAQYIRHLSTTAKLPHAWEYNHDIVGYNYRMSNLNATLILSQLEYFDTVLIKKRHLFKEYHNLFQDGSLRIMEEVKNCYSNYWLICLDLLANDLNKRNEILQLLNENNIMARPLWMPLYNLNQFTRNFKGCVDVCDNAYLNVINLPSSPHLLK